ncbi:MAG: NADAR family protein [Rhodospirillaceae bacterium]
MEHVILNSDAKSKPKLEERVYERKKSVIFKKTREKWGGLSNMAAGYPIEISGIRLRTSEALYQSCRYPHLPEVQGSIISEKSPMTAKMRGKPFRDSTRPKWDQIRIPIMKWCLKVKLVQNWDKFGNLLLETGDSPIVEESNKDPFWSARPESAEILKGTNALGRLLMELRQQLIETPNSLEMVEPLPLEKFLLLNKPIETIYRDSNNYALDHDKTESNLESETESKRNMAFGF